MLMIRLGSYIDSPHENFLGCTCDDQGISVRIIFDKIFPLLTDQEIKFLESETRKNTSLIPGLDYDHPGNRVKITRRTWDVCICWTCPIHAIITIFEKKVE